MESQDVSTTATAPTISSSIAFSKLEKFSGLDKEVDLAAWLQTFDRCCFMAGRDNDDVHKGNMLFLWMTGRARAVIERCQRENNGAPQIYSVLVRALNDVFYSADDRECKMQEFESRIQKLTETEDEYILILETLYDIANPGHLVRKENWQ